MLRTLTELVPFGDDYSARRICGYYLANVTDFGEASGLHEYLIGFFETKSIFAPKGVVKFKHIKNWDRMQSNFAMMQEAFRSDGWVDMIDPENEYLTYVVDKMYKRAKENGIYND